jgi:predicted 2-oxoglutarate/Fe(II)-dependent dioxygenase YbiX
VREQSQRDLLAEIDKVRAAIDGNDMAQSKKGLVLIKQNLLRRWSST